MLTEMAWPDMLERLIPGLARALQMEEVDSYLGGFALVVEDLPASAGDARNTGLIPGLGRSPRGGNDNPLPYSCLGNPTDRWAWQATVYRVMKESDMPEHTHIYLTYIFIILGDSGGGLTLIQSIVMVKLNSKMLLFFFPQISYIQEGKAFRISCQKKKKKVWPDQHLLSLQQRL